MQEVRCFSCGASVRDVNGPVHRYMESSPGCWAAFGEVLAREYSDAAYARNPRLTVDAFAVQHPGRPSPRCIQSVAVHLLASYPVLERGMTRQRASGRMKKPVGHKGALAWLAWKQWHGQVREWVELV